MCVSVFVGRGEVSQPTSHEGDLVAVGSRFPEIIHSSLLASCFPGFRWGAEDGEFLLGTNPAGQHPATSRPTSRRLGALSLSSWQSRTSRAGDRVLPSIPQHPGARRRASCCKCWRRCADAQAGLERARGPDSSMGCLGLRGHGARGRPVGILVA